MTFAERSLSSFSSLSIDCEDVDDDDDADDDTLGHSAERADIISPQFFCIQTKSADVTVLSLNGDRLRIAVVNVLKISLVSSSFRGVSRDIDILSALSTMGNNVFIIW